MRFLRAARAARAGKLFYLVLAPVLVGLSLSCGGGSSRSTTAPNHNAYVTLPGHGSVLLLRINGATGAITAGPETPRTVGTTPNALALLPSKKFLYAMNSLSSTISIFNVASDGTLTLSGAPVASGFGPAAAAIDPTGKYLLVTNYFDGNVSVYAIDAGSGALSPVAGSPPPGSIDHPTSILITPSGKFVYVTNPVIGTVTVFTFSNGVLTESLQSPVFSGNGAAALAIDSSQQFLYVANSAGVNAFVNFLGNISGFNINPNTGDLTPMLGSPFTSTASGGSGPTAITVDPSGRYVYAVTPGSSDSVWCFSINALSGQLTAVTNSPFSLSAGGGFAQFDPSGSYFYLGGPSGVSGYTSSLSTGALTTISGSPFSTAGTEPGRMVFSE